MIPITALMIPIVAILVSHQQKMAQLIHSGQRNPQQDAELNALRDEVRALRETVGSQALLLESVNRRVLGVDDGLEDRVRTRS
jgi:hypothetical protein